MKSRAIRLCALLLAIFYVSFAGGIELLHHHTDGALNGCSTVVSGIESEKTDGSAYQAATDAVTPTTAPCVACYWAQYGQAVPLSVPLPLEVPFTEVAYADFSPTLSSTALLSSSARAPPTA